MGNRLAHLLQPVRHIYTWAIIWQSGLFDSSFYRQQRPEIFLPLWHYVLKGWREGINPNRDFDTRLYMRVNPDVAESQDRIHPFLHYVKHGLTESRLTGKTVQDYQRWIDENESPEQDDIAHALAHMAAKPVFALHISYCGSDITMLEQCIASILTQKYRYFTIHISIDAHSRVELEPYIKDIRKFHSEFVPEFHLVENDTSVDLKERILRSDATYLILLNEQGRLASNALLSFAKAINEFPEIKLIYSDEDKIDLSGTRFSPHFKPDWNPDLFFSYNFISQLTAFNKDWFYIVTKDNDELEPAPTYGLLLSFITRLKSSSIHHIPKVLYHALSYSGGERKQGNVYTEDRESGLRALQHHLQQNNTNAEAAFGPLENTYAVTWPIPGDPPSVTIIIPSRDNSVLLEGCVDSVLEKTSYKPFTIQIVDNGSTCEKTLKCLDLLGKDPRVNVLRYPYPFNFSAIINFAARRTVADVLCLLNDDTEVISPDWLTEMVRHAIRPDIGCVGAKLYFEDNTIQHAGVILGIGGVAGHAHKYFSRGSSGYFGRAKLTQNLSAVTAACLVVEREIYWEAGGLDEESLRVSFNDIDFCIKVRELGYRNLWCPLAELYHYESKSRGYPDNEEKRELFNREVEVMRLRWGHALDNDPAYNPNLTLLSEDFSLKATCPTQDPTVLQKIG